MLLMYFTYIHISQIKQEDVDFHQYYNNYNVEELKQRMDDKQYPPRCKARIKAKSEYFFTVSGKIMNYQVTCNTKCTNKGKIVIPCNIGMY